MASKKSKYMVPVEMSIFEVLRPVETRRRGGSYHVRCRRCGAEAVRAESELRRAKRRCTSCRNKVELYGVLLPLEELLAVAGINKQQFRRRIYVQQWSVERALCTPVIVQYRYCKDREKLTSKFCNGCRQELPLRMFGRQRHTFDKLASRCRACYAAAYAKSRLRKA